MNKLYYVSYLDDWGSGISKKIQNQIDFFKRNNYDVEYISLFKKIGKMQKYLLKLLPFCSEYDYSKLNNVTNLIFIRYGKIDFQGYMSLKKIKKKNCNIIVEIPTFPYDGELNYLDKILSYKDKFWRNKIHKYVSSIVTYSDDEFIFGVKCINTSNFGDQNLSRKKHINISNNQINLIAVASLGFWHGYDRMLMGLAEYYNSKEKDKRNIVFHLVGDGKELDKYHQMIEKYYLEDHVILYGKKVGQELDHLYDKCDIAVDTLGRHRSKIFYNSTIKGKDYLMKGLPIISGVKTELDSDIDFPYYLRVPADDTPIKMKSIISFYDKIYNNKDYDEISLRIRKYGLEKYNVNTCMKPILNEMKQIEDQRSKEKECIGY